MGIFSGILSVICVCLLSAKAVTAKLHIKRADKILMKAHKPVSGFLIVACFIHILCVISVLKNRAAFVMITGILSVVIMVLLICLCHVIKDKKRKMKWHRILTVLMAVNIAGHFVTYMIDFSNYQKNMKNIDFSDINLENVEDGVYNGEYDAGYIYARVEVEIKDGTIISINLLEHRNERGKRAEAVIENMISEQKVDVDAISGATNSSNVIKKAVENAIIN